jgi:hypothetical protein
VKNDPNSRAIGSVSVPVNEFSKLDAEVSDHARHMGRSDAGAGDLGHGGILEAHDEAQQRCPDEDEPRSVADQPTQQAEAQQ